MLAVGLIWKGGAGEQLRSRPPNVARVVTRSTGCRVGDGDIGNRKAALPTGRRKSLTVMCVDDWQSSSFHQAHQGVPGIGMPA